MYSKILIKSTIQVLTGLHIGGGGTFSAIGAVDSPVVKDTLTGNPMIPGSSLKGKMRTLLSRSINKELKEHTDDDIAIKRLFGGSNDDKNKAIQGRLIFSDMILANWDELKEQGLSSKTEVKWENTIKRTTSEANPRQIERVIRGSKFDMELIYEVTGQKEEEIIQDFENIKLALQLLQYDYLGGSGTRGYGKIKFENIELKPLVGKVDDNILKACQEKLVQA